MTLLEVSNVSVVRQQAILSDVSFSIAASEFVSILGPNGAGKTTLLKAILGLISIASGEVRFDGLPISSLHPRAVAQLVGYVPQRMHVAFPFTVSDFLRMNCYAASWRDDRAKVTAAIEEVLSLAELEKYRSRKIPTLSGGELQRVSLAAAVVQSPRLLLLDEPSSSLDPKFTRALFSFLKALRAQRGTTVLAVSHDINSATSHSTRIIALKEGRVAWSGAPEDLFQSNTLEQIYDAPFTRINLPHAPGSAVMAAPNA